MGTNLPSEDNAALAWLEGHIAQWVASPATIGLTSGQTTDLAAKITDARNAFTGVEQIRGDSKARTVSYHTRAAGMRATASDMIADIKSFANTAADPNLVYTTAGITPADPRSPASPSEQPVALTASLGGDGSITIGFAGRGPVGTVWEISRKLAGETGFTHLGHADVATKSFTDTTITAGVATAMYQVRGIRGSLTGPASFPITVQFGNNDGGAAELGMAA